MSGNQFRMGRASGSTDEEVFAVLDEGYVAADFTEALEFSEDELASRQAALVAPAGTTGPVGQDIPVRINRNGQPVRDAVFEYNDRLPNIGQ